MRKKINKNRKKENQKNEGYIKKHKLLINDGIENQKNSNKKTQG